MRELARSQNFSIFHECEDAFLKLPNNRRIPVGSFYGDPVCALIDYQERWCVVAGHGLLVYSLKEPFYPADILPSEQYVWVLPCWGGDVWWVEAIYQRGDAVRFVVDLASSRAGVYELQFPSLDVVKLV